MTKRSCGTCTLCCRLLPVSEIKKPACTPCVHQSASGCNIYSRRPTSCVLWSCLWLEGADVGERPDISHYVVDSMPDQISVNGTTIAALQVWVDPAYPDAHKDVALRRYLAQAGAQGFVAIIRYNHRDGFVLWPPVLASDGQWHEIEGTVLEREVV